MSNEIIQQKSKTSTCSISNNFVENNLNKFNSIKQKNHVNNKTKKNLLCESLQKNDLIEKNITERKFFN